MKSLFAFILLLSVQSFGQAVYAVDLNNDRYFINGTFILVAIIAAIIFFNTRSQEEKKRIGKTVVVMNKETRGSSKISVRIPLILVLGVFVPIGIIIFFFILSLFGGLLGILLFAFGVGQNIELLIGIWIAWFLFVCLLLVKAESTRGKVVKYGLLIMILIGAIFIYWDKHREKFYTETEWHPNGQKSTEGNYKKLGEYTVKEGLWTYWYDNGQKSREVNYKDGQEISQKTWDENGNEINAYKNGLPEGLWTYWYENGQKSSEGNYKDGKSEGLETWWHGNGQKISEGNYKDGKQEGLRTFWHPNGQKKAEVNYKDGRVISRKEWDENGKEIKN